MKSSCFKRIIAVVISLALIIPIYAGYVPQDVSAAESDYVNEIISLVNFHRARYGLEPLRAITTLNALATVRAEEAATSFSHTRPNDTGFSTVITDAGYTFSYAGENLAKGQNSPSAAISGWMLSEGHRANILNSDFEYIGVGIYPYESSSGTSYCWTQLFLKSDTPPDGIYDVEPCLNTPSPDGSGSSDDPYLIETADDLIWYSLVAPGEGENGCGLLTNDISLNSGSFTYSEADGALYTLGNVTKPVSECTITPFSGIPDLTATFDGGGHTISGLYMNSPDTVGVSFGGHLIGEIRNLTIADSLFCGANQTSAFTSWNAGTIENCAVISSVIDGGTYVGGFSGTNQGKIIDCFVSSTIAADSIYGGICGFNVNGEGALVSCCVSDATIAGGGTFSGILMGYNQTGDYTILENCFTTASASYATVTVGSTEDIWTLNTNADTKPNSGRWGFGDGCPMHIDAEAPAVFLPSEYETASELPNALVHCGWFEDSACTIPIQSPSDSALDYIYRKVCESDLLSISAQLSDDFSAIRFASTVDSLHYNDAGFLITLSSEKANPEQMIFEVDGVTRISTRNAFNYLTGGASTYLPSEHSESSAYFIAASVCGIPSSASATEIFVRAYTILPDGSVTYGEIVSTSVDDLAA